MLALTLLLAATAAVNVRATPLFREAADSFLLGAAGTPGIGSNANNNNRNGTSSSSSSSVAAPSPSPANNRSTTNPYIQNGRVPVYTSCANSGTFAMTFDDGTQPSQKGIADLLNANHAKGTFFVNGMNWRCIYDPDMVTILRATYAAGHQIGNHGWGHDHSSQLTREDFDNQVEWVNDALEKVLGIRPALFRPPYGEYDDENLQVLAARNFSAAVNWDHVSGSGTGTSLDASNAMYSQVATTYPTPHIVLQHEQDTGTPGMILPAAISQLKQAGYRLVTLSECLNIPPYQWVGQPQQRDSTWTCAGRPGPGQPHRH